MSAEEDIRRTMGRYIQGHDTHNVEAILAEFADDGEFINPAGTFTGKARVREFLRRVARQCAGRSQGQADVRELDHRGRRR